MSCIRCDREIHPDSPEAGTLHHVCTVRDGKCLRINCACRDCMREPGLICRWCEKILCHGSRPYFKYLCAACLADPEKVRQWQEEKKLEGNWPVEFQRLKA